MPERTERTEGGPYFSAASFARTAAGSIGPRLRSAVSYAVRAAESSLLPTSASPYATHPGPHSGNSFVAFSPNAFALVSRPAAWQASLARTSGAGSA